MVLSQQTAAFLGSLFLGAVLGAVFDIFRIFRRAFRQPVLLVWAEDVLYLLICAVITYGYMLQTSDGRVRIFIIIGEVLGAVLYYLTIGKLVMAVALYIIRMIAAVLSFFYKIIISPIIRLITFIGKLLSKIFMKILSFIKNIFKNIKISLKARGNILYNRITSSWSNYLLKKGRHENGKKRGTKEKKGKRPD